MTTRYCAIDLETEMIAPRDRVSSAGGDGVNVAPYVTPRPVLGSICAQSEGCYNQPSRCVTIPSLYAGLRSWVKDPGITLVFWNAAFDCDVLYTHGPADIRQIVLELYDAGRIKDGKLLDWLIKLARGKWDMPLYQADKRKWMVPQPRIRGLAAAALDLCGMVLNKDPTIRCGFGRYLGRTDENLACIPSDWLSYAAADAEATLRVWQELTKNLTSGQQPMLSHDIQVRADFVAQQMDKQGVRTDQARAAALHELFSKDELPLQRALVEAGLGEWVPLPKVRRDVVDEPRDAAAPDRWKEGWHEQQ